MYSSKILEIFKNPANAGGLQGSNGIGKFVDDECGDFVKIYLKIDENQKIKDAHFKTMGAVGTIIASSAICSLVIGLTLEQARAVKAGNVLEITGSYPADKLYTVEFAVKGLNLAIDDYFERLEKEAKPSKRRKKQEETELKTEQNAEPEIEEKQESLVSSIENYNQEMYEQEQKLTNEETIGLFEKYFGEDNMEQSSEKVAKLVEEARKFTPVVETKIISDEELKNFETSKQNETQTDKKISSAKAKFDAMFEE